MMMNNIPEEDSKVMMLDHSLSSHYTARMSEEKIKIGSSETKAVCCMRTVLIVVLVAVAAGVSTAVFAYTRNNEQQDFDTQYHDHAHKLTSAFKSNAARRLGAVESFAISITSSAQQAGMTWPNVTIKDFEQRASFTLELAAIMSVTFMPVVTGETRAGWEAYSHETQGWLQESLDFQRPLLPDNFDYEEDRLNLHAIESGPISKYNGTGMRPKIFRFGTFESGSQPENGPGPYVPWWQWAPAFDSFSISKYNTLSHPLRKRHVGIVLRRNEPMVTGAIDFKAIDERGKTAFLNQCLARRHGKAELKYEAGPVSDLYFPVFKEKTTSSSSSSNETTTTSPPPELGGILTSYVWWQIYFKDILPENAQGVMAVLENSCNQTFTYIIHGEQASYVGPGDLHDAKYDDMEVTTGWNAFLGGSGTAEDQLPGQCIYQVRVYPTQELEDTFLSNNPMYFTLVVLAVFLFTSLVFVLYDNFVEKRQRVVMKKAVQSTEVVQQLFPSTVRDRLFDDVEEGKESIRGNSNNVGGSGRDSMTNGGGREGIDASVAIADLHENCTVLFADLAGFTKWSSARQPKDVFALLETLYGAFDKVAKKRGVFKVETIGDCYLAITGVPKPQKNHANIMVRFASECMEKMSQVIHEKLVDTLGEDTANLQMRVGVHSGSVTAGVLRGDRARFQLFGDTVNTASRMESNGLPGKIQASAATADILRAGGKGHWLIEREGGVEAKGKGIMQTFWVLPTVDPGTSGSVSTFHTQLSSDNLSVHNLHDGPEAEEDTSSMENVVAC